MTRNHSTRDGDPLGQRGRDSGRPSPDEPAAPHSRDPAMPPAGGIGNARAASARGAPVGGDTTASLLIVVLNYRTADLTIQCLASLAPEVRAVPGARVIVADNDSGDGSVTRIEQALLDFHWSSWARVVSLPRNGGFAWGNNRGIEAGGAATYVLLLNSDTIVHSGCLSYCRCVMDADPTIGAMSCKLLDADGTVQPIARRFPNPVRHMLCTTGLPWHFPRLFGWGQLEYRDWDAATQARDPDWLAGAFLFIRSDVMERLGGLDDSFFFYGEDVEFCHRVWRAGFRCRYDPGASITHLGGASSDPSRMDSNLRSLHAWRGRYLVQRKCYGRPAEVLTRAVDLAACAARVLWMRLTGRQHEPRYDDMRNALSILTRRLDRTT
jgi:N-acetylglucosaminyl-diphospho-decaprenol L-rhamnosyltransferase